MQCSQTAFSFNKTLCIIKLSLPLKDELHHVVAQMKYSSYELYSVAFKGTTTNFTTEIERLPHPPEEFCCDVYLVYCNNDSRYE